VIGSDLERRYATALLDVAFEAKVVDQVAAEVQTFADVFSTNRELREALLNPVFPREQREQVLGAVLTKLQPHKVTRNFLRTLLSKDRIDVVAGIAQTFGKLADEKAGRLRASVTSARPLPGDLSRRIGAALQSATGKTVSLSEAVDAQLLGGLVIRVGDLVYDGSVSSQLEGLRQSLGRE